MGLLLRGLGGSRRGRKEAAQEGFVLELRVAHISYRYWNPRDARNIRSRDLAAWEQVS